MRTSITTTLTKDNAEKIVNSLNYLFTWNNESKLKGLTAEADMINNTIRISRPYEFWTCRTIVIPFGAEITGNKEVIFHEGFSEKDNDQWYAQILAFDGDAFNFRWENHWIEIDAEYVRFHDSEYDDPNATAIDI